MRRGVKRLGLLGLVSATTCGIVAYSAPGIIQNNPWKTTVKQGFNLSERNLFTETKEKLYHKVKPGEKLRLSDHKTNEKGGREKDEATEKENTKIQKELGELQELMFAANTHALLIVIQGQDTAGKDGLCRKVFSRMDPQGLRIEAFKEPTEEELSHDFLWRIHKKTPAKRTLTVFNRSQYEDIIVPSLVGKMDDKTIAARYNQIANFEKMLTDNNTIIVKLYLNVSAEEQEERLLARQQNPVKAWKLSAEDWQKHAPDARKKFVQIYEKLLVESSTKEVPWHIISADHKWFRDLSVGNLLLDTLEPYKDTWIKAVEKNQKKKLPETVEAQKNFEKKTGVPHRDPEEVEERKKEKRHKREKQQQQQQKDQKTKSKN